MFRRTRKGSIEEWLEEFQDKGQRLVKQGDLPGLETSFAEGRMQAQWNNPEHEPKARTLFGTTLRKMLKAPMKNYQWGRYDHITQTRFKHKGDKEE